MTASGSSKMMLLYCILSTIAVLVLLPTACSANSPLLQVKSLVKPESTAPKAPLLRAKSHLNAIHSRLTQTLIVDDGADNASSAYLKCYGTLDEVTKNTAGILNQEQYVQFLNVMTDGRLAVNSFQDLPPIYIMVFYTAACTGEDDCVGENVPEIDIGTTEDPMGDLQLFCKQILKNTESVAASAFEYSIRYDPSTLEEETLANCLAEATLIILLERLTTCSTGEGRLLLESSFVTSMVHQTLTKYKREQHARSLQALGSASSGDIDCDYSIDVTVDRITDSGESSLLVQRQYSSTAYGVRF